MTSPIVGIGELLWDIYPDGSKVAGGAPFNFAFHCHQLGHPAVIVSRVGDDDLGGELRERVLSMGLSDEFIQRDSKLRTGTVAVTLNRVGHPHYEIDTKAAWTRLEWTDSLAKLTRDTVALCHGTLALDVPSKTGRAVINKMALRVWQRNGLLVYDANLRGVSLPDEQALVRSTWLKVNAEELGALVGVRIDDRAPVPNEAAVLKLLQLDKKRNDFLLIVTRGQEGVELFATGLHHRERAPRVEVIDTVGAGDAFTAAMVCLHLEGRPLRECARFANHYAARVCEHRGATPRIDRAEVERTAGLSP